MTLNRKLINGMTRREAIIGSAAAILIPADAWASDAAAAGRVAEVRGEAHAEQTSGRRPLKVDASVLIGDLVSTGGASRLGVELGPKTRIRLGESCRLKIDKYLAGVSGDFTLEAGVMKFESGIKLDKPDLQFRSTYGLIAVRGTRFYMGKIGDTFGVLVGTGVVDVTAAGTTVTLRRGQGTDFKAPGDPPSPPKTWAPERVQRMLRELA